MRAPLATPLDEAGAFMHVEGPNYPRPSDASTGHQSGSSADVLLLSPERLLWEAAHIGGRHPGVREAPAADSWGVSVASFCAQNPNYPRCSMSASSLQATGSTPEFTFQSHAVRTNLDALGNVWFVAKDVCDVLGLKNVSDTLAKVLDDDEKGVDTIYTPGGPQEMTTVSEPGLYRLIAKSRKPVAKAFQRWVFHEVLPTIRRTGSYQAAPAPDLSAQIEAAVAKALAAQAALPPAEEPRPQIDAALLAQLRQDHHAEIKEAQRLWGDSMTRVHSLRCQMGRMASKVNPSGIVDPTSLSQRAYGMVDECQKLMTPFFDLLEDLLALGREACLQEAEQRAMARRLRELEGAPRAKAARGLRCKLPVGHSTPGFLA